ncbi:MAG: 5-formyltetrahydrofolate cyclo-ligase [Pseudomonadota bacterium]
MIKFMAPMFDRKAMLRLSLERERKAAAHDRPDAAIHAARNFLAHIPLAPDASLALYHPIKSELDTAPLAKELRTRGHTLALPVVTGKKSALVFRVWREDTPLVRGPFGVEAPEETAGPIDPDIIVAPLLGFDRRGGRLGYGGGFYDRTLAALRGRSGERDIIAVGYAYGAQEVDAIPLSRLDQPLDWIVTERGAVKTS